MMINRWSDLYPFFLVPLLIGSFGWIYLILRSWWRIPDKFCRLMFLSIVVYNAIWVFANLVRVSLTNFVDPHGLPSAIGALSLVPGALVYIGWFIVILVMSFRHSKE